MPLLAPVMIATLLDNWAICYLVDRLDADID
jgi:hypothetical protein